MKMPDPARMVMVCALAILFICPCDVFAKSKTKSSDNGEARYDNFQSLYAALSKKVSAKSEYETSEAYHSRVNASLSDKQYSFYYPFLYRSVNDLGSNFKYNPSKRILTVRPGILSGADPDNTEMSSLDEFGVQLGHSSTHAGDYRAENVFGAKKNVSHYISTSDHLHFINGTDVKEKLCGANKLAKPPSQYQLLRGKPMSIEASNSTSCVVFILENIEPSRAEHIVKNSGVVFVVSPCYNEKGSLVYEKKIGFGPRLGSEVSGVSTNRFIKVKLLSFRLIDPRTKEVFQEVSIYE